VNLKEEGRGESKNAGKFEENPVFWGGSRGTGTPCRSARPCRVFFPADHSQAAGVVFWHGRTVLLGTTVSKTAGRKKNLFFLFGPPVRSTGPPGPDRGPNLQISWTEDRTGLPRSGPVQPGPRSGPGLDRISFSPTLTPSNCTFIMFKD